MIKKCESGKTCNSEYQDHKYGKGMRVHNVGPKSKTGGEPKEVCTICGGPVRNVARLIEHGKQHIAKVHG